MSKNLVELMAKEFSIELSRLEIARNMLSVVKEHIGLVAEVCPDAGGMYGQCNRGQIGYLMMGEEHYKDCKTCKGSGVIARTEGGDK